MSNYLHQILQNTALNARSYIANSQALQNRLNTIKLPNNSIKLLTADITSLYTNIPTTEGIDKTIKMYQLNTTKSKQLHETALRSLLHNTLNQNIFSFGDQYFKQISGTAMGTIMAPTYANCYLRYLEEMEKPINNTRLLLLVRYIDDILGIYDNADNDFDQLILTLHATYKPLKLTIHHSDLYVNFLDVTISHNKPKNILETKLYQKPEKNSQLLQATSNHPPKILDNLISNELYRRTTLCTDYSDKLAEQAKLITQAYKQNYSKRSIIKAKLKTKKRLNNEQPKQKPNQTKRIILSYNKHSQIITNHLKSTWKKHKPKNLPISPIKIAYRMQKNISKILTRAKLKQLNNANGATPT